MRLSLFTALFAGLCLSATIATNLPAQEDAAENGASAAADPAAAFETSMSEWRTILGELRELQVRYKVAKADDRPPLESRFKELVGQGSELTPTLVANAMAAYAADPNPKGEAARFLIARADADLQSDRYEEAYRIASLMADHEFDNPRVYDIAGVSAFAVNEYDAAEKYLNLAKEKDVLSDDGQMLLTQIPTYRELWAQEQPLREAEAAADDLPRVLLKTNRGDIVIELFENEAPNTVANFISLVEQGFYDGLSFHRVIRGFMAQGGDPKGDGTGGPDYMIECEVDKPNARNHFTGTLSMAHAGRNTGGSQFFITFRPTPHLNGRHTAFGRVIEGMDAVSEIRATENLTGEPDKIIEAKVLRKRPHPYKPNTLAGR